MDLKLIVVIAIIFVAIIVISRKSPTNLKTTSGILRATTTCCGDPNSVTSIQSQLNTIKAAVSALNPVPTSNVLTNFNSAVQNVQTLINNQNTACSSYCTNGTTYNPSTNMCTCPGGYFYINPNGNAVCSSSPYLGCYPDNSSRTTSLSSIAPGYITVSACNAIAKAAGSQYFGMQNWPGAGSTIGNTANCMYGNSSTTFAKVTGATMQSGNTLSCSVGTDGNVYGGAWSNAVYRAV